MRRHFGLCPVIRRFEGGRWGILQSFEERPVGAPISTGELSLLFESACFTVHNRARSRRPSVRRRLGFREFTADGLSRMLHCVAQRLMPVYLHSAEQLADADIPSGDETSYWVIEVKSYYIAWEAMRARTKTKAKAPQALKNSLYIRPTKRQRWARWSAGPLSLNHRGWSRDTIEPCHSEWGASTQAWPLSWVRHC